jgi:hypothetical protein
LSGKPFRRHSRQNQLDLRSLAWFAIQMKLATQTICDDGVDDMQARPVLPCSRRVVKNGSNALRLTSILMPQPSSEK